VAGGLECLAVNKSAISCQNLSLGYGKQAVIQQLNIDISSGVLLAVVGANGVGKSTLLRSLMGELKPIKGSIQLNGFDRHDIAYLPQRTALEQHFPMDVQDCVAMGLWKKIGAFGFVSSSQQKQIDQVLASVGLAEMSEEPLFNLSGGQIQRTLFARLLLQDAPVILLDEPFNSVDEQTIQDLMVFVKQWHQEGRTILAVLHDLDLVRHYFPDTLCLANGHSTLGKTTDLLEHHVRRWAA
jgi:zinc/manganese transport system ATP-binding protein